MDKDSRGRPAEYLGDGAYVRWTGYSFVVYTSDGLQELAAIELDGTALKAFDKFRKDIGDSNE
jgi:hypothetical protein